MKVCSTDIHDLVISQWRWDRVTHHCWAQNLAVFCASLLPSVPLCSCYDVLALNCWELCKGDGLYVDDISSTDFLFSGSISKLMATSPCYSFLYFFLFFFNLLIFSHFSHLIFISFPNTFVFESWKWQCSHENVLKVCWPVCCRSTAMFPGPMCPPAVCCGLLGARVLVGGVVGRAA